MIRSNRALRFAAAFVVLVQFSPPSQADAADVLKPEVLKALQDCIKGSASRVNVCVNEAIPNPQEALKQCKAAFCQAATRNEPLTADQAAMHLKDVSAAIEGIAGGTSLLKAQAGILKSNVDRGVADLQRGKRLEANEWDVASAANPVGDLGRAQLGTCGSESVCATEAANLVALRISSFAVRNFVQITNWAEVEKSAACTQLLRKRYESYFDASRFQWPWELYINGQPWARGETPLACEGFRDVPTRQWIFMHPTLAIRYSDNASQNLGAAVVVEVFGIRRWQWSGAEAVNARGGSLILSYSDQTDAKSLGWGAMVHLKDDVSVGLVSHKSDANNKVSLLLSYEFGQLVGQDRAAACKKLFDASLCERVAR